MGDKPIQKERAGLISGSCFLNKVEKDGKEFEFKNVNMQRSWLKKGSTDEYESENMNIALNDIPKVRALLQKIYLDQTLKSE